MEEGADAEVATCHCCSNGWYFLWIGGTNAWGDGRVNRWCYRWTVGRSWERTAWWWRCESWETRVVHRGLGHGETRHGRWEPLMEAKAIEKLD